MKMRKILSGVMAVSIASAALLAGCGQKEADNSAPYEIDWYFVTGSVPGDVTKVEQAADEYLKDKLNVTLKLHYLDWGAYSTKLNVMIAGGDKFDICHTSADTYRLNAAKNAYVPLNDLIDKYAPKTKDLLGDEFLKGSQINGQNYGLPANKDKGHDQGMLYRTDIAEELGLTEKLKEVKTLDDMYPILDIVKEKKPDMVPLMEFSLNAASSLVNFDTVAFPIGFMPGDETLEVLNYVETPEYRDACIRSRNHRVKGYTKEGTKLSAENHFAEFCGLKAGKDKEMSGARKYDYTQISMTPAYMTNGDATGSLMAISRTCKNPERVMQFLELFNTDTYLNNLIVYGVEGVNYTKLDDNTIDPIKNSGYGNAGMQWEFGNTFINYVVKGEDPDKAKNMEEYNAKLIPAPSLGFSFDSEPVKTELGACQNVQAEYVNVLANGGEENPEAVLDEYINKLKSAGAEKIKEEVKRQLAEWKNSNNK